MSSKFDATPAASDRRNSTARSQALFQRALDVMPGGSTRATIFYQPHPPYAAHGEGSRIVDVDGNVIVDFTNNFFSAIHGHANPKIVAAVAVIDVETIIIDGAFPVSVREQIIARTRDTIARVNRQGLSAFRLIPGSIGNAARAMGGACLPLLANFTQDREVLFKENSPAKLPPV